MRARPSDEDLKDLLAEREVVWAELEDRALAGTYLARREAGIVATGNMHLRGLSFGDSQ